MQARNHIPFAMSWWWLMASCCSLPITAHGTMTAAIGGLLPDLDHPQSALGRRLPLLSIPFSSLFGHRGVTHSLFAVIILLATLTIVAKMPSASPGEFQHVLMAEIQTLIAPLTIGYLSHIVGDSLTPSGVPLLWPKKTTYSLNLFKTWSWQETFFVGIFTIATVLLCGVGQTVTNDLLDRLPLRRLAF